MSTNDFRRSEPAFRFLEDVLHAAISTASPLDWLVEALPPWSARTMVINLSLALRAWLLHQWPSKIDHTAAQRRLSEYKFECDPTRANAVCWLKRQRLLTLDGPPPVRALTTIGGLREAQERTATLGLTVDDTECVRHVMYCIARGILEHGVQFSGHPSESLKTELETLHPGFELVSAHDALGNPITLAL